MSDYSPANVFHRRSRHNPPHSDTHRHTLNFSKLTRTLCPTLYPDSAAARLRAAGGVTPERGSGERDGASGAVTRATDLADSLNVAKKKNSDWRKMWRRRILWTCVVKSHDGHANVSVVKPTSCLFIQLVRWRRRETSTEWDVLPSASSQDEARTTNRMWRHGIPSVHRLKKKKMIYLFINPNTPPKNTALNK